MTKSKHPILWTFSKGFVTAQCRGCGWQSDRVRVGNIGVRVAALAHRAPKVMAS